jgi:hypothetical protein
MDHYILKVNTDISFVYLFQRFTQHFDTFTDRFSGIFFGLQNIILNLQVILSPDDKKYL